MKVEMGGGRYEYENNTLILILGELKNILIVTYLVL